MAYLTACGMPLAEDGNEEIFVRLMNDEMFGYIAAGRLRKAAYRKIRNQYAWLPGGGLFYR